MTLLFFDGMQDGATVKKPEWNATWRSNQTGRDGTTNGAASTVRAGIYTCTLPSAAATCIMGGAFVFINAAFGATTATAAPIQFVRSGTVELVLTLTAGGYIEVRRSSVSGTLLGTTSGHTPLSAGAWNHIQAKVLLHSSAGSVEVKINEVTVLTLSGVATAGTTGSVTAVNIGSTQSGTGSHDAVTLDDFWVCDEVDATASQGSPLNDFLGDLRVAALLATSDGDTTAWTPSTGTNHAALVDESPPNTTDYNGTLAASGLRDLYNVTDLSGAVGQVLAVQPTIYAAKSDAGSATIATVVKENGVVTDGATQTLTTTYLLYTGTMRTRRPSDSGAWTVTDINNLQVGVKAP